MARTDLTGQLLDERYRVLEPIGEGAMGSVYRGERVKLGRIVAIKVLNESVPDEATRRRFEREALAMAKLEHPHVGSVIDVGIHDGCPYVVMEFVSGQNLKELIKTGPLPIDRAIEIARQVLSGLAHAHEHGIIHRDIKPANIVLSQKAGVGDHAKILDFGIARSVQDKTNLTGALVLGTPNYMAPEQIRGGDIDHRVDFYACGILLFELLTGAKPFHADDPMAVCMQHLSFEPPTLEAKAGRSFGPLEAIVARALAKDPAQRFANAEAFSAELAVAARRLAATPPQALSAPSPAPSPLPAPSSHAPSPPTAAPLSPPTPSAPPAPAASISLDATVQLAPEPPATVTAAPRRSSNRRAIAIGGGVVMLVASVIVIVMIAKSDASSGPESPIGKTTGSGSAVSKSEPNIEPVSPPPVERGSAKPPVEPSPNDPVASLVTQAQQMSASGRREAAIMQLQRARKTYPKDGRLPYQAAKLFLDKMWWPDGLKQARGAIALDPAYKSDADLIKLVLKCFTTTMSYDWRLAGFLHDDIGPAAKPFLQQAAASDPNPIVRKRAAAELKRYP